MSIFALLHPARIIRRKAIWDGLLGQSNVWRAVAFAMIAREGIRWISGAGAEPVDVAQFGSGRNMQIVTSTPLSRKEAKRLKKAGKLMPLSEQRAQAMVWAQSLTPDAKRESRRRFARSSDSTR